MKAIDQVVLVSLLEELLECFVRPLPACSQLLQEFNAQHWERPIGVIFSFAPLTSGTDVLQSQDNGASLPTLVLAT